MREVCGEAFCLVVPGIRPAGSNGHDQVRVLTPAAAIERGADYLVVGRPITGAADPVGVARGILREPCRRETARSARNPQAALVLALCRVRGLRILPGFSTFHRCRRSTYGPTDLTPEQRTEALKKAAVARKKRAELKGELKSGKRTLEDVLERRVTTPSGR